MVKHPYNNSSSNMTNIKRDTPGFCDGCKNDYTDYYDHLQEMHLGRATAVGAIKS